MLDQMIAAYDRGLLVPFIGAGMSWDVCPLWPEFVKRLEGVEAREEPCSEDDLVARAARAVRKLRFSSGKDLPTAVAGALSQSPGIPPDQTEALARIHWPLVVTTNYDDLYVAAAHEAYLSSQQRLSAVERREVPLLLLGRGQADCQRVLTTLREPDLPILWALQGFVGGQAQALPDQRRDDDVQSRYQDYVKTDDPAYFHRRNVLAEQLVVGHAEYRRVATVSAPFRRSFGELYRSRSLLFLGSGLRDKYFLDLFSEIIELYGPSAHPHYAFLKGNYDKDFLQQYFGIWVTDMAAHDELPDRLRELAQGISSDRRRQRGWQFSSASASPSASGDHSGLRIIRGAIPEVPGDDECIVFSAGGTSKRPRLSGIGKEILARQGLSWQRAFGLLEDYRGGDIPVNGHQDNPGYLAVRARLDPWEETGVRIRPTNPTVRPIGRRQPGSAGGRMQRDLRTVPLAVQEVMQAAQALRRRHVHCMMLAAGPLRTFPQSRALLQMVRGWARWQERATGDLPELSIYTTERDVLYDLQAGRLNLAGYLLPDVIDFWLEIIQRGGMSERYLAVARTDQALQDFLLGFDIKGPGWKLELTPHPCLGWGGWTLAGVEAWEHHVGKELRMDLETFGILPGSTLTLEEPGAKRPLVE